MDRLTPISPGVVHSSPCRTRLKTAKWKHASEEDVALVKDAIERVPGVTDVRPMARGFVIEHEARADVVENIGIALAEVSPVLLEHLTEDPHKARSEKSSGGEKSSAELLLDRLNLSRMNFSKLDFSNMSFPIFDGGGSSDDSSTSLQPALKKTVPAILAGAGALLLLEGESILAGVGPLALFYWAFDYSWKMKQERLQEQQLGAAQELSKN